MGLIGGYCMFDIFIDGKKVGTNLSEDGVLVALNQLVNKGSGSFEEITIQKQTKTNKSNIELIDKWENNAELVETLKERFREK